MRPDEERSGAPPPRDAPPDAQPLSRIVAAPIVPRGDDVVSRDPDLWMALAILDRVFGADQVTVLSVVPRRPA